MSFFVPYDNLDMRRKYEPRYGCCGPATIAVFFGTTVGKIIADWPAYYRGYAPIKEMEAMLKKRGLKVEWKKGGKARVFPQPTTGSAIVRVQWLRDDGTEFYWMGAPSHYVLVQKKDGEWWVFCNAHLWFKADSDEAHSYLDRGYVSSYFEVST